MAHRNGSRPVLVTGAYGFIGRRLVNYLIEQGDTVVAFDTSSAPVDRKDQQADGLIHQQGDIRRPDDLLRAIETHDTGSIVHLAALLIPDCFENPVLGAEVNVIGHINVLDAARACGIDKVVYASSIAARPRPPLGAPPTLYGVFKHCDEEISQVYFRDHGLATIGLRPVILYGPGREIGQTAAITMAMKAAAQGESFTIPFRESTCFQHIDETADIFRRCLAVSPEKPVISDMAAEMQTTEDVANAIRAVVPDADIEIANDSRAGPPDLDDSILNNLLGQRDRISLEDGVRRTIDHYRSTPM
tara:strand:+ start:2553 stop:3461 length:909 start_codon:yes stop_codon:yes gene_type:complete